MMTERVTHTDRMNVINNLMKMDGLPDEVTQLLRGIRSEVARSIHDSYAESAKHRAEEQVRAFEGADQPDWSLIMPSEAQIVSVEKIDEKSSDR